ncbi:hypothetical protein HHL11_16075 [Ramlibacter sp. G-1-2-2]|uniref:DUF4148 domain-containing protein n=1 Tax=Ramlibacter agri TaxID=2728837 RepID=A0A848H608_9BURK|nr:hypothetical protein [Ramlibacter agri]NML45272.1 hypothetical protein [Ramlibacter agri]
MKQHHASMFGYLGSVAAAGLAAALMSGNARAESPLDDTKAPFVSERARAEVLAERDQMRPMMTSYAYEWTLQQGARVDVASGYTRAQAKADYIAAREQVHAMNSEAGGAAQFGRSTPRLPAGNLVAGSTR